MLVFILPVNSLPFIQPAATYPSHLALSGSNNLLLKGVFFLSVTFITCQTPSSPLLCHTVSGIFTTSTRLLSYSLWLSLSNNIYLPIFFCTHQGFFLLVAVVLSLSHNRAHSLTAMISLGSPINPTCMLLDCGRKAKQCSQKTGPNTWKRRDLNQELSCCEITI